MFCFIAFNTSLPAGKLKAFNIRRLGFYFYSLSIQNKCIIYQMPAPILPPNQSNKDGEGVLLLSIKHPKLSMVAHKWPVLALPNECCLLLQLAEPARLQRWEESENTRSCQTANSGAILSSKT